MPAEAVGQLLALGLPGVSILVLLRVIQVLYREKEELRNKAEALLADVNEKRIAEALKTVAALGKSETLMDKMNDNIERLTTTVSSIAAGRRNG